MPKISVVIPLYNKEKSIASTLQAVLNQTFTDYEIVIVNDGSMDNSVAEVEKIHDARIRLINQQNAGVSAARNRGIEEAKGELIAFLDADDEWMPEYLATQYHLSQKYPACSVFSCNYEFRDAEGMVTSTIIRELPFSESDGILSNYFEVASCSHPPLWTSAIVVKGKAIQAIGGFPVGITHGEDLLTWANLAVRNKIAYTRRVLATYCLKADYGVNSKPVNIPQGNQVGDKLESLLEFAPSRRVKKELKQYIGHWYKIRASLFLRGGEKKNALINIGRVIFYSPGEWKIYIYLLLLLLPTTIINYVFKSIK